MEKILNILEQEVVPAEGCTEPIALAYAASKLTETLGAVPDRMDVYLSGNLIKNIKSVTIPNSDGMIGMEAAAAMGALLGDADKGLMVISDACQSRIGEVRAYISEGRVKTHRLNGDTTLHIKVSGVSGDDSALVEIKDTHTNIVKIEKNGAVLFEKKEESSDCDESADISFLTIQFIYDFVKKADIKLYEPLLNRVIELNTKIAEDGLKNEYGAAVGKTTMENVNDGILEDNVKNLMVSFAAAASDARMNGCPLAVMSACGSGNQGITATLPVIAYCDYYELPHEELLRGLLFSLLTLVHIKSYIGRLSAYCGAVCSAAAAAGAITYLQQGSYEQVCYAIENTLGTLSGLVCDGAKSSCAAKIASSVSMGYDSVLMALKGRRFKYGEGLIGKDVESTLLNVGTFAQDGLKAADDIILGIMLKG